MAPRTALLALLLLSVSLTGCFGGDEDGGDGGGGGTTPQPTPEPEPEGSFPERTDAADKTVLLVGGYPTGDRGKTDVGAWNQVAFHFSNKEWPEPLSYSLYACEVGYDRNVTDHGDHDAFMGGASSHGGDCGDGHDKDTPIEHLAFHWAWAVYDEFGADYACVDVVAHDMGGLVVRYALWAVEGAHEAFPPRLCVEDVVTFGTPHAPPVGGSLCADDPSYQCKEMTDVSGFLSFLAAQAPDPQSTVPTDWTVVGSDGDTVVPASAAVAMEGATQWVIYMDSTVRHDGELGYQRLDPEGTDHRMRHQTGDGGQLIKTSALAPVALAEEAVRTLAKSYGGTAAPTPKVNIVDPKNPVNEIPGKSFLFEGTCARNGQELVSYEWATRQIPKYFEGKAKEGDDASSINWTSDGIKPSSNVRDPWELDFHQRYDIQSTHQVRLRCTNDLGISSDATWTVDIDWFHDDDPTAKVSSPSAKATVVRDVETTFTGTCLNEKEDLDRVDWWYREGLAALEVIESEDLPPSDDDPVTVEYKHTFTVEGTYTIRLTCYDYQENSHSVDWDVTVVEPTGSQAAIVSPEAESSTTVGDTTFTGTCTRTGGLTGAEWYKRPSGGTYSPVASDALSGTDDPWEASETINFPGTGVFDVKMSCMAGATEQGFVEWSIQVNPA